MMYRTELVEEIYCKKCIGFKRGIKGQLTLTYILPLICRLWCIGFLENMRNMLIRFLNSNA